MDRNIPHKSSVPALRVTEHFFCCLHCINVFVFTFVLQNALQFIKQYWKMPGRPLFLVLIREDNIK